MPEKNTNNVDQIRELIFGSQLKEYDEKFTQLNTMIKIIEEKLSNSIETSFSQLQKESTRTMKALEEKIDNLAVSTQKERLKFKELIDSTDEAFQDQLNNQKSEWVSKLKVITENMSDENQKLGKDMQTLKTELHTTLQAGVSTLSDDKLSRDAMAQMLLDMAMKIQGTDIHTLLTTEQTAEK